MLLLSASADSKKCRRLSMAALLRREKKSGNLYSNNKQLNPVVLRKESDLKCELQNDVFV